MTHHEGGECPSQVRWTQLSPSALPTGSLLKIEPQADRVCLGQPWQFIYPISVNSTRYSREQFKIGLWILPFLTPPPLNRASPSSQRSAISQARLKGVPHKRSTYERSLAWASHPLSHLKIVISVVGRAHRHWILDGQKVQYFYNLHTKGGGGGGLWSFQWPIHQYGS